MSLIDPSPASIAWLGDVLLQSSALLAAALIGNLLLRRAPAAWRHALLLAATVGVPALFILSATLPSWKLPNSEPLSAPFQPRPIEIETTVSYEIGAPVESTAPAATPAITLEHETPSPAKTFSPLPWLLVAWFLGTLGIWLRMTVGIVALRKHRGASDRQLANVIATEAEQLGITVPPNLVLLDADAMPMTWRLHRHVLALPKTALGWPGEKLRRVIRHELGHIVRNDCRTAWLADACLAILWFHPLAWFVRRALGRAREAACDDLALGSEASGDNRSDYAQDLLDVVASHSRKNRGAGLALALAMANKRTGIHRRLESILDPTQDRRAVPRRARRWMAPLWAAGLAGLATIAACRMETSSSSVSTPPASGGEVITKEYRLVEPQQRFLGILAVQNNVVHDDPFASSGSTTTVETWLEGPEGASAARNSLQQFGIQIPSDSPIRFSLADRYTLEVKADAETHAKIAAALDGDLARRQVKLQVRIFEVEDLKWLSDFVSVDEGANHTGLLSHAQRDKVVALLEEKSGDQQTFRDFPSVVTRFGQRVKVESIREFIYPTEYDPPEIPANWEKPAEAGEGIFYGSFPVTPANPTAFEMRPVGTTFEFEPNPKLGDAVELHIAFEETRFLGFVNYGAPIQTMGKSTLGKPVPVVLTENRIEQPVFRTQKMDVTTEIPPGHVLVLAGLRGSENPKLDAAINSTAQAEFQNLGTPAGTKPFKPDPSLKGMLYIVEPTLVESP